MDEIVARLQRVYAALDATLETDILKVPPLVTSTDGGFGMVQDFRGGLSDAEFENLAHSVIHNVANLRDHARWWMKKSGKDTKRVEEFIKMNLPVAVIQDLSNNDKHGYPRWDSVSGKAPKLANIRRVMRLSTGDVAGASAGYAINPAGEQTVFGSSAATLMVTGDVQNSDGLHIGDLHAIQVEAVEAWEKFLQEVGVLGGQ